MPSTTETLAALGVGNRVVGRTRYCVHPRPWVDDIPVVGGTKDPDLQAIAARRPDLILANAEENRPEQWPALSEIAPVAVAYPRDVAGAVDEVRRTGRLVGAVGAGESIATAIEEECVAVRARTWPTRRCAYLVWRRPWIAAGRDTYVSALLAEYGFENVVPGGDDPASRYPEVTLDELRAAAPDVVWLSTEPYAFTPEHAAELGTLADRARPIDGELASWHGVRLVQALPRLARLVEAL